MMPWMANVGRSWVLRRLIFFGERGAVAKPDLAQWTMPGYQIARFALANARVSPKGLLALLRTSALS